MSDCSLELILITELDDDSVGRSEMEVLTSSEILLVNLRNIFDDYCVCVRTFLN